MGSCSCCRQLMGFPWMEGRASIEFLLTMWPLQDFWKIHTLRFVLSETTSNLLFQQLKLGASVCSSFWLGDPKGSSSWEWLLLTLLCDHPDEPCFCWQLSSLPNPPFSPSVPQTGHVCSQLNQWSATELPWPVWGWCLWQWSFPGCALCSLSASSVRIRLQCLWWRSWEPLLHAHLSTFLLWLLPG